MPPWVRVSRLSSPLEASGTATVRVELDKDSPLTLPRLRVGDETVCVGMGNSFPEARHSAVEQAFELLTETHGLAPTTAYAYLCARVSLRAAGPSAPWRMPSRLSSPRFPTPGERRSCRAHLRFGVPAG